MVKKITLQHERWRQKTNEHWPHSMVTAKVNGIKCQISVSLLDTINKRPSKTEVRDIGQANVGIVDGNYYIKLEVRKVEKSIIISTKLKL